MSEIQQKMWQVVKKEQPEYVKIISFDKVRDEKWPQEWAATIIIFNENTNKYYSFDVMGNDSEYVTDLLDSKFTEVIPTTLEINTFKAKSN